jgi:hypothetical protein
MPNEGQTRTFAAAAAVKLNLLLLIFGIRVQIVERLTNMRKNLVEREREAKEMPPAHRKLQGLQAFCSS